MVNGMPCMNAMDEWNARMKRIYYTCPNGHLSENAFTLTITLTSTLNPKAQKRFRENQMTSFFGQVSRYAPLYPYLYILLCNNSL